jgi:hypothetical protein
MSMTMLLRNMIQANASRIDVQKIGRIGIKSTLMAKPTRHVNRNPISRMWSGSPITNGNIAKKAVNKKRYDESEEKT